MYNEQVLIGSLLGDGCLSIYTSNVNPLYSECHSEKQLDYLKWKNQFFNCKIKQRNTYLKKTNKIYIGYYFRTGAKAFLLPYYHLFYKNGKKSICIEILEKLEPLAIAIWYCDDGSYLYYNNNLKISTGMDEHVKHLISRYFKNRFGINFKVQKECIYLNSADTRKFVEIIKDYVPDCMQYKLGTDTNLLAIHKGKNQLRNKRFWIEKRKDADYMRKERIRQRLCMKKYRNNPINRERIRKQNREQAKKRYWSDSDYREKVLARGRSYHKKRYRNDPEFREKIRLYHKKYNAKNKIRKIISS